MREADFVDSLKTQSLDELNAEFAHDTEKIDLLLRKLKSAFFDYLKTDTFEIADFKGVNSIKSYRSIIPLAGQIFDGDVEEEDKENVDVRFVDLLRD